MTPCSNQTRCDKIPATNHLSIHNGHDATLVCVKIKSKPTTLLASYNSTGHCNMCMCGLWCLQKTTIVKQY